MGWTIRQSRAGDADAQAAIYNTVAGSLPGFKRTTPAEVARRVAEPGFDPGTRWYAEDGTGTVVGYAQFQRSGRTSVPWCLPGHEGAAEPLFDAVLAAMRERGIDRVFAAYRADWEPVLSFLERRGFQRRREMHNYVLPLSDMPTRMARPRPGFAMRREDVPDVFALAPRALRSRTPEELERFLFDNPLFSAESAFVLRRRDESPIAAAVLVQNSAYADPRQVDVKMPCFRLGAFGTEGLAVKRIDGLFSFLARDNADAMLHGLTLLEHAAGLVERLEGEVVAAQAPSDAPHLMRFYDAYFQRQGSFPVLELPETSTAV